ncbi:MAG: 2-amino-4-hydroxy-6-hydroxymethyldihydropteridine diphosphokinase [Dehalococcoidales bacterium]|nr:2-amino-4-hydroxy-6-hydroxymethyldihydropteridine diphosphokinase [Dehalococcoidales bacterium]
MHSKSYLSIGSNLGERKKNIDLCLKYLKKITKIKKISSVIETKPHGVSIKQNNFLNLVLLIDYANSPHKLLDEIHDIEKLMGRRRSNIINEPRVIDIDIITFGNIFIKDENLEIPHPRYTERLFVLYPLSEIAPSFIDPKSNKTIKDLLLNAQ